MGGVKNFCEGLFGQERPIKSIEGHVERVGADRFAGAQRDIDFVRGSGRTSLACGRDEVVL